MSIMKLSVVVILSIVIVCCVSENRMIDEVQYKNHRLSKNDSIISTYKYPVYATQVYVDLSKESSSVKPAEQSKATETPADVVRMYINPAGARRKKQNQTVISTTQAPFVFSSFKTSQTPVYFVTAKNFALNGKDQRTSVYSPPSTSNAKETADLPQSATAAEDGPKRTPAGADGTKTRRVLKSQQQAQSNLLYATTTQSPPTANTVVAKLNSSNASKPFATVLVPKQILDGHYVQQRDYVRDNNSFRPIAPPAFAYKPSVDANVVDNRRASVKTPQPTSVPAPTKYGFTDLAAQVTSYKVEEYKPAVSDKNSKVNNQRSDHVYKQHNAPKQDIKYGFAVPESYVNTEQTYVPAAGAAIKPNRDQVKYDTSKQEMSRKNVQKYDAKQWPAQREYYPATEVPKKETKPYSYLPYSPAGPIDVKSSPAEIAGSQFEFEKAASGPQKEHSSPSAWYTSINPNSESNGPAEIVTDNSNTKGLLKSILRDMFKSKQQSEKPPSVNMDEIIDSYFKTNRPNVDFTLGNYDIETDMSCNLRSSRHITDGQCVTNKPVVEAVCADRCLVYSSAIPISTMRSSMTAKQVEALHCVDGDSKLVRVQLQCKDGNTLNNVIKVVTNCRCKLHQIQPQMRSNTPSIVSSSMQDMMVNPDIMQIASGKF